MAYDDNNNRNNSSGALLKGLIALAAVGLTAYVASQEGKAESDENEVVRREQADEQEMKQHKAIVTSAQSSTKRFSREEESIQKAIELKKEYNAYEYKSTVQENDDLDSLFDEIDDETGTNNDGTVYNEEYDDYSEDDAIVNASENLEVIDAFTKETGIQKTDEIVSVVTIDSVINEIKSSRISQCLTWNIYIIGDMKFDAKLRGAKSKYAFLSNTEKALCLIDYTVFGSAKEGLVLTTEKIYANFLGSVLRVPLSDINTITAKKEKEVMIEYGFGGTVREFRIWGVTDKMNTVFASELLRLISYIKML